MQPTERAEMTRAWLDAADDLPFQRGRKMFRDGVLCPIDRESNEWLGYMLERSIGLMLAHRTREMLGIDDE
jgi:hypothetical protein